MQRQLLQRLRENDEDCSHVVLLGTQLMVRDALAVVRALEDNTHVRHLNMGCSCIGEEVGMALGAMLEKNRSITTVVLDNNPLGDNAVESIAKALQSNASVTELNLYWTRITDVGAAALADAIAAQGSALRKLNVANNHLGESGVSMIHNALKKNSSMRSIDLRFNSAEEATMESVADLITSRVQ